MHIAIRKRVILEVSSAFIYLRLCLLITFTTIVSAMTQARKYETAKIEERHHWKSILRSLKIIGKT